MTQSPLRCCTSIIRSSALVQASFSLSMDPTCAWPRKSLHQKFYFRYFFARISYDYGKPLNQNTPFSSSTGSLSNLLASSLWMQCTTPSSNTHKLLTSTSANLPATQTSRRHPPNDRGFDKCAVHSWARSRSWALSLLLVKTNISTLTPCWNMHEHIHTLVKWCYTQMCNNRPAYTVPW